MNPCRLFNAKSCLYVLVNESFTGNIHLHTVKWFPVYWMIKQFYLTHKLGPKITTTPGKSRLGSNDNERVLHISQSSRALASPSDEV